MEPKTLENTEIRKRDRSKSNESRRKQLIEATIESIAIHGFNKTTLSTVTSIAKMSHGIVNFHFQSKDQLLLEAMKYLVDEHSNHWRAGLGKAKKSAADQLLALIATDFDPEIANPKRLAVWFAYWGEANNRPAYREIADNKDSQRREQIKLLCEALIKNGDYANINSNVFTTNLEALIDGLWLHLLLFPNTIDTLQARQNCLTYLASNFPRHFSSTTDGIAITRVPAAIRT